MGGLYKAHWGPDRSVAQSWPRVTVLGALKSPFPRGQVGAIEPRSGHMQVIDYSYSTVYSPMVVTVVHCLGANHVGTIKPACRHAGYSLSELGARPELFVLFFEIHDFFHVKLIDAGDADRKTQGDPRPRSRRVRVVDENNEIFAGP
jgi:hypothetical protein